MAIDWDAEVLAPVMSIFGEGTHGVPGTLPLYNMRGVGSFRLADAVFDEFFEQVEIHPDTGAASTTHRPVLGVRTRLFARPPAQNDDVYIPSTAKSYIVRDVQPDGHGHAKLMLMEAA